MTAAGGASVCVCVCVPCFLWERKQNIIKKCARMLRWGQVHTCKPTLPRDFKSNHAATVTTAAAVQPHYNSSTSASISHLWPLRQPGCCCVHIMCVQCSGDHICSCTQSLLHAQVFISTYQYNEKKTHVVEPHPTIQQYSTYSTGHQRNRKADLG